MKNILFIFTLFITFTACGDKQAVTDVLNRAEVLMNEQPDSSLALLRTLTFDDFQKESNRARYALLHSQALDKNYIDVTNDSLISVAVEYYKDKDDVRSKFLAYYYEGRVHVNAENLMKAMISFSKAEQLGGELKDSLALGLLYSNLGDIYREYYDFPKSLASYQQAEACYRQASKEQHRLYAILDQAEIVRNMGDVDESYRLLLNVWKQAESLQEPFIVQVVLGDLFMHCVKENRLKEALSLYDELHSRCDFKNKTAAFWGCVSRLFASQNDESKALQALDQGWILARNSNDSVIMYSHAAKVYEYFKRPEKSYEYVVAATLLQNELVRVNLQQPILTMKSNYLSDELELQSYKLRMEKHLRVHYIIVFSLLLVAVVWMLLRKLRVTKENARKTIDDLNDEMLRKDKENHQRVTDLLQELEQKDQVTTNSLDALRAALEQQETDYRQYIHRMEKMMNRYQVMYGSSEPMTEEEILCWKTLHRIVKSNIYQPEKDREHLIYYLDTYRNGFAGRLGQAYPALKKERLLDVCYLFAIGLTVEQMAKMLNIGERTVEHYMTDICQETGYSKRGKRGFEDFIRSVG